MHSMPLRADTAARDVIYGLGFSRRKRGIVRRFLADAEVHFVRNAATVPPSATIAVWGNGNIGTEQLAGRRILRIEDGFLRSVGLGADLTQPLSLAVDGQGMYYDASRPSDLESLLQCAHFDAGLLLRAARLRARIVESRITKYNVGTENWCRPMVGRKVVVAVGQVESDAALRYGAPHVHTNLGLLQAVRTACPDAYLVYKPHPDVQAGLRAAGRDAWLENRWCDEVVMNVSMDRLIDQVDEVHVLTSLAGFEALLRGRKVATYGRPFYAGWGLTRDALMQPRRTRRLTLDALVAAALILYPRYVSIGSGDLVTPEQALDALIAWRESRRGETAARKFARTLQRAALRFTLRALMGQR